MLVKDSSIGFKTVSLNQSFAPCQNSLMLSQTPVTFSLMRSHFSVKKFLIGINTVTLNQSLEVFQYSSILSLALLMLSFISPHLVSAVILMLSHVCENHSFIGPVIFSEIQAPIAVHAFRIPCFNPSMRSPPNSAITVDGDVIPNAFLKPSTNGSIMCSLIQVPISLIALIMPFKTPSHILPPASSM